MLFLLSYALALQATGISAVVLVIETLYIKRRSLPMYCASVDMYRDGTALLLALETQDTYSSAVAVTRHTDFNVHDRRYLHSQQPFTDVPPSGCIWSLQSDYTSRRFRFFVIKRQAHETVSQAKARCLDKHVLTSNDTVNQLSMVAARRLQPPPPPFRASFANKRCLKLRDKPSCHSVCSSALSDD